MIYSKDYVSKLLSIAQNDENTDPIFVRISQVMLSHLPELGEIQNRQLAKWCYVDASTISRFVKYLGFINFGEFKDYFREYNDFHGIESYFDFTKIDLRKSPEFLVDSAVSALRASYDQLDFQTIKSAVDLIEKQQEIILCGDRYSQLAAADFQLRLLSLGYYAKTFKDVALQQEHLAKHQGLMILFTASLGLAKMHIEKARQNRWQIITISRNPEAKKYSDICILYDDKHLSDWTSHSVNDRFCMQLIIDQLIYQLAARKKLQNVQ